MRLRVWRGLWGEIELPEIARTAVEIAADGVAGRAAVAADEVVVADVDRAVAAAVATAGPDTKS